VRLAQIHRNDGAHAPKYSADKKKLKEILGFLDDEVYKGVFLKETYITNSKRKIQ